MGTAPQEGDGSDGRACLGIRPTRIFVESERVPAAGFYVFMHLETQHSRYSVELSPYRLLQLAADLRREVLKLQQPQ